VLDNAPVSRDGLMQHLLDADISTRRGIMNAHQEPAYVPVFPLTHSEKARDSVILLPLYTGMKEEETEVVIKRIINA
jgi:dTDP-4-amino-4,6-dideoxygalactose transaminase